MTMDEVINVLSLQEEILQFNHFTNEDAWQLGIMLVAESKNVDWIVRLQFERIMAARYLSMPEIRLH